MKRDEIYPGKRVNYDGETWEVTSATECAGREMWATDWVCVLMRYVSPELAAFAQVTDPDELSEVE